MRLQFCREHLIRYVNVVRSAPLTYRALCVKYSTEYVESLPLRRYGRSIDTMISVKSGESVSNAM